MSDFDAEAEARDLEAQCFLKDKMHRTLFATAALQRAHDAGAAGVARLTEERDAARAKVDELAAQDAVLARIANENASEAYAEAMGTVHARCRVMLAAKALADQELARDPFEVTQFRDGSELVTCRHCGERHMAGEPVDQHKPDCRWATYRAARAEAEGE